MQVPVERFAGIANASSHLVFADAEGPGRDGVASAQRKKVLSNTFGVAVALLTKRVVVSFGCTTIAFGAHKVVPAVAVAVIVTGDSPGSQAVATTSCIFFPTCAY